MTASIFNPPVFVRVFSKTLIVDCVIFHREIMTYYVYLARYIKNELSILPEIPTLFFPTTSPMHLQDTYINDKLLALIKTWSIRSCARVTEFFN